MDKVDVLMHLSAHGEATMCQWAADNLQEKHDNAAFVEMRKIAISALRRQVDLDLEIADMIEWRDKAQKCLEMAHDAMRQAEPRCEGEDVEAFLFIRRQIRDLVRNAESANCHG